MAQSAHTVSLGFTGQQFEHGVHICQIFSDDEARAFDGATIMDVLKVHPLMIVRNAVMHNPFSPPPEEYLQGQHAG